MSEVGLVASHVPPADAKITRVGFYEVERTIGRGNYACVRYARHRVTKTEVAIKIVDKTRLDAENLIKVQREVDILKKLDHPHIIKLYQVMETENCIYLVTEFAPNGEIYDYVAQNKCLHEDEARRMFWQIVSALEYCHNLGIVHRDLKAENLLLDGNCCIKIADFGFSNFFGPDDLLKTFCGSPPYAAPEIFDGRPYKAEQLDVWSMGVVLYALVCGALPFEGANLQQLRLCVLSGRYRVPYFMSQECEQLLRRMLHVDPKKRATIAEVKNHAWMQKQNWEQCIEMEVKSCQLTTSEPNQYVLNTMESMGIDRNKIIKSLEERKFDNLMAIYLLMVDRLRVKQQEKMREREFGVIRTYTDPDLTNSSPTKDEMVSTVTRRARPPLFSIRDHPTFRTTDTTASSGIGDERASTLSRQSTIGTVGSIDEGVESDMAGSSTSHAAFSSGELVHIPLASGDFGPIDPNETDIFNCPSARTVIGAETLQVKQTAQGMNNSMNPCSSKPVSCNGMTMSPQSSFREGLRASDNTMFESLKSPFPTGQLRRGEGPLGETPEFKPPPEPVEQMQKMRIGPRHYAMNRTRQSAAGSLLSKRISLPENLEFQPQKLLNMKQSMHVEQQLGDGTNSTFEGKCALKARIQQKQRHIKSRMQLLKQQSYQAAHKQSVLPLSLRGPESFEASCTGQLSPIEDIQREESMDAV